jgi:hypothetical protein
MVKTVAAWMVYDAPALIVPPSYEEVSSSLSFSMTIEVEEE